MAERHSHCSWCGSPFASDQPWPRLCRACGHTSYLNPLPVAVVLLPVGAGLVVIRRNTEPRKGTLTLPGGYIDYGETWQQAAGREAFVLIERPMELGFSMHTEIAARFFAEKGSGRLWARGGGI